MKQTIIKHREMGSLQQVADSLWKELNKEVARNGHSDLTLTLEVGYYSLRDIIQLNSIVEVQELTQASASFNNVVSKSENKMEYLLNNYHCSEKGCDYTTGETTQIELDATNKLMSDGGHDKDKISLCPKCKNDSLVFLSK